MPIPARSGLSLGTIAGFAAGGLIAGSLVGGFGLDHGMSLGLRDLLFVGGVFVLPIFFRRFWAARVRSRRTPVSVSTTVDAERESTTAAESPAGGSSLEYGLSEIRRTDPGFDPTRLAGYTGMVFRDAQTAWASQDIHAVRDRMTPEMYVELQAQHARLRTMGHADRAERIDVTAEITEAWQEDGRDYVTACIEGSIIEYTVDQATHTLIRGSPTVPKDIEEFWTFTRPAGLNFWMLSAIQL